MNIEQYMMGKKMDTWRQTDVKSITFVVTEDCNLICKYCYITGKNQRNKMTFEVAKKAVDYILGHPEEFPEGHVIWEFIGGEPFLEVELIDQITDYIKTEMFLLDHKWFSNYRISISTNGMFYDKPEVQKYIKKNQQNLSIGISIDGNKAKHDLQRIKPDGSGSYDEIVKHVPLWLEQFPTASTKATFASADLPYLKDSIISLYNLGITLIPANVIFEDDWKEGDDLIYENQLMELADYIIENELWDDFNTSLFSDQVGFPLPDSSLKQNYCGAGKMVAIDFRGNFYPCVRFVEYSLNNREGYVIGDYENGYDHDKLRPFLALNLEKQSSEECINCQVATSCAWCQGYNYDSAKLETIYERATDICIMHKARVRANDYYWTRLKQVAGIEREKMKERKNHLYFLLSNQSVRNCSYEPDPAFDQEMSLETFKDGIEFARRNFYTPVLMLPPEGLTPEQQELLRGIEVRMMHAGSVDSDDPLNVVVYDNEVTELHPGSNSMLLVKPENLSRLCELVQRIFTKQSRINLVLEHTGQMSDEELLTYEKELEKIAEFIFAEMKDANELELNVLSDRMYLKEMANCNAGVDSFTLAPDGKFYPCPAFYYTESEAPIGTLETGIAFDYQEHLTLDKSPLCSECDAYQCRRCVYQNKQLTKEYLIPGRIQCMTSHIERMVSKKLAEKLSEQGLLKYLTSSPVEEIYSEIEYYDPLEKVVRA